MGLGSTVTYKNGWRASASVTLAIAPNPTDWGAPVAGATVRGSFEPGGTARCVTNNNGTCSLTSTTINKDIPNTKFTVTSVAGPSMNYDPTKNAITSTMVFK